MDAEKSSNSSFEDLSYINEADIKSASQNLIESEKEIQRLTENVDESKEPQSAPGSEVLPKLVVADKNVIIDSPTELCVETSHTETETMTAKETGEIQKQTITSPPVVAPEGFEEPEVLDNTEEPEDLEKLEAPEEYAEQFPLDGDDEPCDILGNGQLVKRVLKKSKDGERPARGNLVCISFTGSLSNGTIVEKEENMFLHVGDFEVVQGLDMTFPLMKVGEEAEVTVDPRFAYGTLGLKNETDPAKNIPPNSTIIYKVHLIDAKCEEFADLKSFEIRKTYGNRKRQRANFWYNRNNYNIAIQLYKRALEFLDDRDGDPDNAFGEEDIDMTNTEAQELLHDRLIVYNNLSMAQIKISAFDAALKSVENVLRCEPNNSKALYRKGRVLEGRGDIKGAISIMQKAATLEPENRVIQQDLAKLIIKARREEHNEKEMYQKMLGQAKKLEQKHRQTQKLEGSDNSKLKLLGYLMGSILIGVAGVAIYRYKY